LNQHQQHALDYLVEEYRVLREQIGDRGLRFPEDLRPNMGNTTIEVVTKF
jgi:hypothetical protein